MFNLTGTEEEGGGNLAEAFDEFWEEGVLSHEPRAIKNEQSRPYL
ncbi:MAG: hypothetical protein ACJAQT_002465 [Akkermansiaceae bacterium]